MPGSEFRIHLERAFEDYGIAAPADEALEKLRLHFEMMIKWNRLISLSTITNQREAARLHYAESALASPLIPEGALLLDIGSGAGFPSIPLAVLRPDINVTALESNQKKSIFLKEVKDALSLKNFRVATSRVEDYELGEFSVLTSRALERCGKIIPVQVERMNTDQQFILYCGQALIDEIKECIKRQLSITIMKIPHTRERMIALFRIVNSEQLTVNS